jgi:hypothetical protein
VFSPNGALMPTSGTGSVDVLFFRRHSRHWLRFVAESPVVHDRVSRTVRFRMC